MWSDIARESSEEDLNAMAGVIDPYRLISIINF